MKRTLTFSLLFSLFTAPTALAGTLSSEQVSAILSAKMAQTSPYAGAYVRNLSTGEEVFAWKSRTKRIPASVEKLYTTSTLLLRDGPDAQLDTRALGGGEVTASGTLNGNVYLEGNGDPSLSSKELGDLADQVAASGIKRISGHVSADSDIFDNIRGVPDSNWAISPYVGPLSGLAFDHGSSKSAAVILAKALRSAGVTVDSNAIATDTPSSARELAKVSSPPMSKLAALTNKPSDNFYAEMLLKGLGARYGGRGSTRTGAKIVRQQLAQFGVHPRIVDGSGLSRANRTSPQQIVELLTQMNSQGPFEAFYDSLSTAGQDGTLAKRMRHTAAQGSCHAKTGTLSNVSGLAGFCKTDGDQMIAFAFLMNGVNPYSARKLQDKMTVALTKL